VNITLLPHQEKAIDAAIHAGVIHSVEELIDSAISRLPQVAPSIAAASQATNLVDLFEPIRRLFKNGELDFSRDPSPSRLVDLS
jgi:hypothetical protein